MSLKFIFLLSLFVIFSNQGFTECVPAKVFVKIEEDGGYFIRINPKGNKIIFGDLNQEVGTNRTVLLKLSEQVDPQKYTVTKEETPFNDETYPVDTSADEWELIASPHHESKMRYYEFDEFLKNGKKAKPIYEDDFDGDYHSAAELKSSQKNKKLIRTVLWRNQQYADYEYIKGNGSKPSTMLPLKKGRVCQNIVMEDLSPVELIEEEKARDLSDKIIAEYIKEFSKLPKQVDMQEEIKKNETLKKLLAQFEKIKFSDKIKTFDEPILNKTGDKIAAVVGTHLKVFQINGDMKCTQIHDLGTYTSKARFSYPSPDGTELVIYKKKLFEGNKLSNRIVILNMKTGEESVVPSDVPVSSFIEFSKDGRIFFFSDSGRGAKGYWIMDLNQISATGEVNTDTKTCIKRTDIVSSSAEMKENSSAK